MSISSVRALAPSLQVVDLSSVRAVEVDALLRRETDLWSERLDWDVSGGVAALGRAIERGGIAGKAARLGARVAGLAYYSVESGRGVLPGFLLSPEWDSARGDDDELRLEVAGTLLRAVARQLRRRRVRRVESQFIGFDAPWLVPCFESEGFQTHWREFLRLSLGDVTVESPPAHVNLLPWRAWNLSESSLLMNAAHADGVDAAMNELYRSPEGCRVLLNNIVRQRGCGDPVAEASFVARHPRTDRVLGFALVTETARRKAHLAQLAVSPQAQRQGIGRALLARSSSRLRELGFETLSLMVSGGNFRALSLYRAFGFEPAFRFPVFSWDR